MKFFFTALTFQAAALAAAGDQDRPAWEAAIPAPIRELIRGSEFPTGDPREAHPALDEGWVPMGTPFCFFFFFFFFFGFFGFF
jgi:hypothetical protein